VDVKAATPIYRLRSVALRYFSGGFGCSEDLVVDAWKRGLGAGVDVGEASPVVSLRCVALRCWGVSYDHSVVLVIDSFGVWHWGRPVVFGGVSTFGQFPYKPANLFLLYQ
jgi:hypothetical protein